MGNDTKDTFIIQEKRKINAPGVLKNRALLVVLSANFLGKTFIIDRTEMVLGRSSSCRIQIADPGVSAEHCRIFADDSGSFSIDDLGSTNQTFVNRKAVKKPVQLFYGDRIVIGTTIFRFFHEEKLDQ